MTLRDLDAGGVYTLTYDAENHMIDVSGTVTATFLYAGDGQRVMSTEGVTTTVYIGNYFECQFTSEPISGTMTTYYFAGATRVAMREDGGDPFWLLGDHLGSTSVAANYDGSLYSRQGYKPWGETRFVVGQTPTGYQFTGQLKDFSINLYWFNSRWFDQKLGRFIQPDIIIPEVSQGVQAWDRYAYVNNSPINYNDPSGHCLVLCTAIIGGAIGAIAGAVGYTAYTVASGNEFNRGHMLLAAGGGAAAGSLIGSGVGIAAGMSSAAATAATVAGADGDPTNELNAATRIGKTAIETVTEVTKIESQLSSKADLLGITRSGNMGSLSNPMVQKGLSRLNNISSSTTSRIWKGRWIRANPIPVYEYIEKGIGVVRDQSTGTLVSVTERLGYDKLQELVNRGEGIWLR